ncbi:MAG: xanthine dehydrogenase family protein subunit M [Alphaproteobacteria bacterium]|nr:xanthine dehydrogenase family protein subunit M [Alphaproteobacteria bacterium]
MKSPPFEYVRARSVDEACELLSSHGEGAKLIAGGQSLVPMMAFRLLRPSWLVDINEITALKFVDAQQDTVRIGAGTRQCVLAKNDALAGRLPLVRQALAWVGHVQTRNRGTIGGSLVHADPSAELPLAAQVLGARMKLRSKTSGQRMVAADQFFSGPMMTVIRPDECLEEIHWPVWQDARVGSAFLEISRRHGDFAMVGAAAQVAVDESGRCTRIAFGIGGAGPTPLAFPKLAGRLVGTSLDADALQSAVHDAAAELEPGTDTHATAAYRRHLARVLAGRVLRSAYETARVTA